MSTIRDSRFIEYRGFRFRTVGKGIVHCQACLRITYSYVGHVAWHETGVGDVGLPVVSPLEPAPVQAAALTGMDQVSDVVHSRHCQVVGHSRRAAPRDIPSFATGPATLSAPARATEALDAATGLGDDIGQDALRAVACSTVSAALHDRVAIRAALRTADDDYQAREHEANVGRGPEPGDWWLFMVNAMADHLLGQGHDVEEADRCAWCGVGNDPRCPYCGSDQ
ncbi:hypothetical protein JN535_04150 [Cellulosimicrobium cellulans]|uniref:hypothetical protein n=1 Tax=Cellulosimicrobium cellulans TaxID=1710 RepID=UPI0019649E97|nr:hypothetical protein [Cellulosimicrobium cellulans]MBN0039366.1 hypothetical protein [Cellulosimicrobium cellulans]